MASAEGQQALPILSEAPRPPVHLLKYCLFLFSVPLRVVQSHPDKRGTGAGSALSWDPWARFIGLRPPSAQREIQRYWDSMLGAEDCETLAQGLFGSSDLKTFLHFL